MGRDAMAKPVHLAGPFADREEAVALLNRLARNVVARGVQKEWGVRLAKLPPPHSGCWVIILEPVKDTKQRSQRCA
jgi:hypothetical protein